MKFNKVDLLTLLISLFILSSCKNPDSIGLGIDPTQAVTTNLLDTATVNAVTIPEDSVATSSSDGVLGYFYDPIFGTTQADIAASISLPGSAAYSIPKSLAGYNIDSAVLVLPYLKRFYGDTLTTSYTISVYQLNQALISNKYYYHNNTTVTPSATLLGSRSFIAHPRDSIKYVDIVTGGPDTVKKVGPQLRVPIDLSFIRNYFFKASGTQLSNNAVFQNFIKGLYITVSKTNISPNHPGGLLYFDLTSGTSTIDVYYRYIDTTYATDTVITQLPVGSPSMVKIARNYNNSDIANQLSHPNTPAQNIYLQGNGSLRAKISFPYLANIIKNLGSDATINRAELVVTPVPTTYSNFFSPSPRLTLYRKDIAGQRTTVPDATYGNAFYQWVAGFGGFYDSYHTSYHFVITGYVENLMRGKIVDYGTYLAPADTAGLYTGTETISTGNNIVTPERVQVGGSKSSPYRIKLNILYNRIGK
jgi:hypothetical protein